jgi:hypothetical protein
MAGFEFMYRSCGAGPTIKNLSLTGRSVKKGDMLTLTAGTVYCTATADTNMIGVALASVTGGAGVKVPVIVDPDAVYAVTDASIRVVGATLDVAGSTGAMTIAASSNKEFVVVEDKTASEKTKVRFNVGKHHYNKAQ